MGKLVGHFQPSTKKITNQLIHTPNLPKTKGGLAQNPHPRIHKCPQKINKLKSGDETTF